MVQVFKALVTTPTLACLPFLNCFLLLLVLLLRISQVVAQNAGPLPLIVEGTICAVPPESISNDGCDDVCPLTTCCSNWMTRRPGPSVVTIRSNTVIDCTHVVCPNVCRMACDRGTCGCNFPVTDTAAFVFLRYNGGTIPDTGGNVHAGHTGFGLQIGPDFYVYGALENPSPDDQPRGAFNGFWIQNGSIVDMLCAMKHPPYGEAYDVLKHHSVPGGPNICAAIRYADSVYDSGFSGIGHNCLDITYNVLTSYGITGLPPPAITLTPRAWYDILGTNTAPGWGVDDVYSVPGGCDISAPLRLATCDPTAALISPPAFCTAPTTLGCDACLSASLGLNCCLLPVTGLAPTCICGVRSSADCSSGATFCPA